MAKKIWHMANRIDWLSRFFAKISGCLLLCLILLTVEQVIARRFFDASSTGLQELQWHLFGAVFLLAGAHTMKLDQHVRVDIFYSKFSKKLKSLINILGIVFFVFPMCFIVIHHGLSFSLDTRNNYSSGRPSDYYSSPLKETSPFLYKASASLEALLRETILVGEISSNPGGLEARWLVKLLIPISFILIALQGIAQIIRHSFTLSGHSLSQSTTSIP